MSEMVKFTIDGVEYEGVKGASLLDTARQHGIEIPHFCYHSALSWTGQCRMCYVEIEKMPKIAIACCTPVAEGMVVHTKNDKVREARKAVLELILLHHPIDCPICDQAGECKLQDYYMEYGLYDSHISLEEKDPNDKVVRLGEQIVLDRERCVICFRCVRFCAEISKSHAIKQQWRGGYTQITTYQNQPINDPYSGNLADVCPVGALTSAKFRFKCRSWLMDKADSICNGCSTGCNIRIDSYNNEIQRFVPRKNMAVNSYFICDEGRMSWEGMQNSNRMTSPMMKVGGTLQEVSWDEALNALISRFRSAGKHVAGVASAKATNEELLLFKTLILDAAGGSGLDFRTDDSHTRADEMEDHLLRRKDKNPNTNGALSLGVGATGMEKILKDAEAGDTKLLVVLRNDILAAGNEYKKLLKSVFTVVLSPYRTATAVEADMVLPIAEYFETNGSFTNSKGLVQKFEKAVDAPGETREGWELLRDLVAALEAKVTLATSAAVSAVAAEKISAAK